MSKITGCILLFFSSLSTYAQTNLATINGDIGDPFSHAVPTATVKARSTETGAVRSTITSLAGAYQIPGLMPGEYTIEVRAEGFATATRTTRVEVGQNLRLDMSLTIGETKT